MSGNGPKYILALGILLAGIAALTGSINYISSPKQPSAIHSYELIQLGEMRRDQFLVDASTGRVWMKVCKGGVSGPDCLGDITWDEMYVQGVTPKDSIAYEAYMENLRRRAYGK